MDLLYQLLIQKTSNWKKRLVNKLAVLYKLSIVISIIPFIAFVVLHD